MNPELEVMENVLKEAPTIFKNQSLTTSSHRRHKRKLLSKLPLDPITNIAYLYSLVFDKKPAQQYTNMWGKKHLETHHPRAHAAHNKNVERIYKRFFL